MQINRVIKKLIERGLDPIDVLINFTQDYDSYTKNIIAALDGADPLDVAKVKLKYDELYFRVINELNTSVLKEQEINARFDLVQHKHKLEREPIKQVEEQPMYYFPAGQDEVKEIETNR